MIDSLPVELGKLTGLRSLNVACNNLAILPAEMSQLEALKILNLSENAFFNLPLVTTRLSALENLDISDNGLTHLAADVACIRSLKVLSLEFNPILALPAEIGNMESLRSLNLRHTLITSLPMELRRLPLNILRLPGTLCPLIFTDFLQMDREIGELTAALTQYVQTNINLISTLASEASRLPHLSLSEALHIQNRVRVLDAIAIQAEARLDELKRQFDSTIQTDLAAFCNHTIITQ
jgi:Leucine-rich repeat (LRR) protein